MRLIDADAMIAALEVDPVECPGCPEPEFLHEFVALIENAPTVDAVPVVRCKDCKHNPKLEWLGCPMASLNEKQRPETAWCWKGEQKDGDGNG